jgi:hypothetical protein
MDQIIACVLLAAIRDSVPATIRLDSDRVTYAWDHLKWVAGWRHGDDGEPALITYDELKELRII